MIQERVAQVGDIWTSVFIRSKLLRVAIHQPFRFQTVVPLFTFLSTVSSKVNYFSA